MEKCCARVKSNGKKCNNNGKAKREGYDLCGVHVKCDILDVFTDVEGQFVQLKIETSVKPIPQVRVPIVPTTQEAFDRTSFTRINLPGLFFPTPVPNILQEALNSSITQNGFDWSRSIKANSDNYLLTFGCKGDCVICQTEINQKEECLYLIKCEHFFHEECLKPWISKANTCPCCREKI